MRAVYVCVSVVLMLDGVLFLAGVGDGGTRYIISGLCFLVASLYIDRAMGDSA